MVGRKLYMAAIVLAVLALIAATINAWLAAPGPMALVTCSVMILGWITESRRRINR